MRGRLLVCMALMHDVTGVGPVRRNLGKIFTPAGESAAHAALRTTGRYAKNVGVAQGRKDTDNLLKMRGQEMKTPKVGAYALNQMGVETTVPFRNPVKILPDKPPGDARKGRKSIQDLIKETVEIYSTCLLVFFGVFFL